MRFSAQAGTVVRRIVAGIMTLRSERHNMGRPSDFAGCPLVMAHLDKVQLCARSRMGASVLICRSNGLAPGGRHFDFFAGSAGRAPLQGSYFSLGSGMRSSAAL